jgi:hypothetical protein
MVPAVVATTAEHLQHFLLYCLLLCCVLFCCIACGLFLLLMGSLLFIHKFYTLGYYCCFLCGGHSLGIRVGIRINVVDG